MSVYQLKDGRWVVQYRSPDPGGPRFKREYFGRDGRAAAEARNAELGFAPRAEQRKRKKPPGPTLNELANEYLQAREGSNAATTIYSTWCKLRAVVLPELGDMVVYQLTEKRLDGFVRHRLAAVKAVTVRRDLDTIQSVLNFAVRRRLISHNPVAGYRPPPSDAAVIRPPSEAEVKALVDAAPEHLRRALVLSYYLGLRPGESELMGLSYHDVDWERAMILVRAARKGGPVYRLVPIHPRLMSWLRGWRAVDGPEQDLIVHYYGRPIRRIKTAWNAAKKRAGITRRLRPYDIRHAFATEALAAGADLKSVSHIMGHSRVDTTLKVYQHISPALVEQAAHSLPDIGPEESFKKSPKKKAKSVQQRCTRK